MILLLVLACHPAVDDPVPPVAEQVHPYLVVGPEDKQRILDRAEREPWSMVMDTLEGLADREIEVWDTEVWDHGAHGRNAETARASAAMAWLYDDAERAEKAKEILRTLPTDFDTNATWDVNIRMPSTLFGTVDAIDLLQGTDFYTDEEADADIARITTITDKFYRRYGMGGIEAKISLFPSQNNHPIRTAAAIAYVAMAYPDNIDAPVWANFAFSELDYLWGPEGRYVQPDGGVSEGPFYYGFAMGPTIALSHAAKNVYATPPEFARDCENRNEADPWFAECTEGEPFTWTNPFDGELVPASVAWSLTLSLPSGLRPPLGDAYLNAFNGGAVIAAHTGQTELAWDWARNTERPYEMRHGMDLVLHHLAVGVDPADASPPTSGHAFMPEAGNAVFRTGWASDDIWLLLVAENGAARKTLHDHVDGTSFSLAAYGDYLLVDPGYYKPNDLNNAVTSAPEAHNVILVDGAGAPDKGLLMNFGDADAFLEHTLDEPGFAYAEARQSYDDDIEIVRSVLFVDDRWFVVADAVTGPDATYTWRLGGNAGYDVGGVFSLSADGASWARDNGAVDVYLTSDAGAVTIEEPPYQALKPPHVGEYSLTRAIEDHAVMDGVIDGVGPDFLAVLAPYKVGATDADGPLDVTPVQGGWRVGDTVVYLSDGSPITVDGKQISSDGRLVVVHLDRDAAFVTGGSTASVDGVDLTSITVGGL